MDFVGSPHDTVQTTCQFHDFSKYNQNPFNLMSYSNSYNASETRHSTRAFVVKFEDVYGCQTRPDDRHFIKRIGRREDQIERSQRHLNELTISQSGEEETH